MTESENIHAELTPIGKIRTGFHVLGECPSSGRINPNETVVELKPEFAEGLTNIELASHLLILYWLDKANSSALLLRTRADEITRGVFASRSPNRPNPVAVCVVKLVGRDGCTLRVSGLECLDGTPLVDIKPYVPTDDCVEDAHIGWSPNCGKTRTVDSESLGVCKC